MQPIEYRGFKIGIESLGGNYLYIITYLNVTGEVFDASPALYDSEEEAVEDAKYVIDKYHDTK